MAIQFIRKENYKGQCELHILFAEETVRTQCRNAIEDVWEKKWKSVAFEFPDDISAGAAEELVAIALEEIQENALAADLQILFLMPASREKKQSLGKKLKLYLEQYFVRSTPSFQTAASMNRVESHAAKPSEAQSVYQASPKEAQPEKPAKKSLREKIGELTDKQNRRKSATTPKKASELSYETLDGGTPHLPLPQMKEAVMANVICNEASEQEADEDFVFDEEYEAKLAERVKHLQDSFSDYLMYLIESKGMTNAEVYKRALVDKKVFSKIKNNPEYHTQKMTAMCLCIGAKLNMDETRDLLARAGYALSPSNKTDVIFSFFIENQIYDMIELDIQLEEHGLQCLIS